MSRRHPGLLLIAACLAALALRVMVPVGWMPATGSTGVSLILCSGTVLPVDPLADPQLPSSDTELCDFALAIGPALIARALLLPLLALPLLPAQLPPPARAVLRRHRPRPLGQGPPRA
ncbi:hypothetical protein [Sandarakinorhabdus sp.]|uniref:hypothetical protein n=1 Tax=Sandarakinorhabdus sp. TaxID=1916663 RepID=UPI003F720FAD